MAELIFYIVGIVVFGLVDALLIRKILKDNWNNDWKQGGV